MLQIRTALFAPGINPKVMSKAIQSGVDAVILDLEDSVPLASKVQARENIRQTITELFQSEMSSKPYVMVRTNAAETGMLEEDIRSIFVPGLDMVLIPKAEEVSDLKNLASYLDSLDREFGQLETAIGLQIETALGVYNCFDLIKSSSRVQLTCIGTAKDGDLQNDLGSGWSIDGPEMLYARSKVLLDSRAAKNIVPIDGVFADLMDEAGLLAESQLSAKLGYVGRTIIHPKQKEIVEQAYAVSLTQQAYYEQVILEFETAEKNGVAAITINHQLVDYAMYKQAKRVMSNLKK